MKNLLVLLLLLLVPLLSVAAAPTTNDSIVVPPRSTLNKKQLVAPAALMGGALIAKIGGDLFINDHRANALRHQYVPNFHTSIDDYALYAPAAAFYLLKLCGVPSRSDYMRGTANLALSFGFTQALVQPMKYSIDRMRPDGSTNNSFPSSHTATAFAFAHVLHKEFGAHSPYISLAGYGVATGVGVCRVLNNRHWLSDVFFGAGLGIVGAELAYYVADRILPTKGWGTQQRRNFRVDRDRPSFVRLKTGVSFINPTCSYNLHLATPTVGINNVAAEAALFANEQWGAGLETLLASIRMEKTGSAINPDLGMGLFVANGYYNRWLTDHLAVIGKVGSGILATASLQHTPYNFDTATHWVQTAGVTGRWYIDQLVALDLIVDYYHAYLGNFPTTYSNLTVGAGFTLFIR